MECWKSVYPRMVGTPGVMRWGMISLCQQMRAATWAALGDLLGVRRPRRALEGMREIRIFNPWVNEQEI